MAKKDIENEPMLEENSDEVLLEESSGTEAMLEETSDSEVLLEEDSSESVLLEEDSEILLEETTVQIVEEENSKKKEEQQDFTEIHERWDAKLPKEFIDKILEKISPYCSVEEIENTIFSYWYNWLNSDEDDLTKYLKYKDDVTENKDDVTFFKRKKLDDLEYKRAHKNDSPEAKNAWKQAVEDVKDIDKAIRGGANTLGDLKLAVKHNLSLSQELEDLFLDNKNTEIDIHGINRLVFQRMIKLFTGILQSQLTPKEKIIILDELRPDIQQPLADQFIRVRTERKHQQQAKTALKDVERVAKPNAETIVKADDNRKQQAKTTLKDAEPDTKKKRVVEARKDNVEARQAKAAQNRKQMVAEKETNEIKKGKGKWGCISIIAIFIIYSLIPSSMKSCHKESESEDYVEEVSDVTYDNDGGNFDNLDVSSVEEMLEKKFDYVSKYDNYFEIRKKRKYGIADLKGNIRIRPQYDYISAPYVELGVVEVRKDRKYGMVSLKTFSEIIETKYDYISSVSEESKTFEVRANRKYGLFSADDLSEIVAPTYDYIGSYHEDTGLFEVRKDRKYGLFSPKKRKEVVPCEYDYLTYDDGLYRVRKDWKNGYLNSDGSLVKPLQ